MTLSRLVPFALLLLAAGCATPEHDLQPVVDSLHTSEMNAAIDAAAPGQPRQPPPQKEPM